MFACAESQVVSLWKVFLQRDARSDGCVLSATAVRRRARRLSRDVQLAMLRSRNRSHPFYWAGFIQSGD